MRLGDDTSENGMMMWIDLLGGMRAAFLGVANILVRAEDVDDGGGASCAHLVDVDAGVRPCRDVLHDLALRGGRGRDATDGGSAVGPREEAELRPGGARTATVQRPGGAGAAIERRSGGARALHKRRRRETQRKRRVCGETHMEAEEERMEEEGSGRKGQRGARTCRSVGGDWHAATNSRPVAGD